MKKVNGMKRNIIISLCILSAVGFGSYIGTLFLAPEQPTQAPKPVPVPPQVSNNPPQVPPKPTKLKIKLHDANIEQRGDNIFLPFRHRQTVFVGITNFDKLINLRVIEPYKEYFTVRINKEARGFAVQSTEAKKNIVWQLTFSLIANNAETLRIHLEHSS